MNILMKLSSVIESANEIEKESTAPLGLFGRGVSWIDSRNAPLHSTYVQRRARARLLMH